MRHCWLKWDFSHWRLQNGWGMQLIFDTLGIKRYPITKKSEKEKWKIFQEKLREARKRLFFFVTIPIDQTFKEFLMELVGKENYYTYRQWIMNKKISQKSNEK